MNSQIHYQESREQLQEYKDMIMVFLEQENDQDQMVHYNQVC